jgi:hypothetical protein
MRTLKNQGKTTIRLTAPYAELMAEFERIQEPIEVSIEPIQASSETGDEPGPDLDRVWAAIISLIPSPPAADLFLRHARLDNVVFPNEKGVTTLIISTEARTLEPLLKRKIFMVESAYFQITGSPASVQLNAPNSWTRSTKSSPTPTTPECTRSPWLRSDSPKLSPNPAISTWPSQCPTSFMTPTTSPQLSLMTPCPG